MKKILLLLPLFFITGCVSQEQIDQKLAMGCRSGVDSLLAEQGKEILSVKTTNFSNEQDADGLHRRITITALEKDGWLELEKEYSCLFYQEWGPFKNYHRAALAQITMDDRIIGKKDGMIEGDVETFIKLVEAVDIKMAQ